MPDSTIKAYEGEYLFKQGNPYVISVVHYAMGGDLLAEIFTVIQRV